MTNRTNKIRVGVYGYGALGASVVKELGGWHKDNINLVAVFSNRAEEIRNGVLLQCSEHGLNAPKVEIYSRLPYYTDKIDVMLYCGKSSKEYHKALPLLAANFNVCDTFDDHPIFLETKERLNKIAKETGHTVIMGYGWSPGAFSDARIQFQNWLPGCEIITAYGPRGGGSRGHGAAIRELDGVADAFSITTYKKEVVEAFEQGRPGVPTTFDLHRRDNLVVLKEGADPETVKSGILNMEGYFIGFETTVRFVAQEELEVYKLKFEGHGGKIVARRTDSLGRTARLSLEIDAPSNTDFTAGILLSGAYAADKLAKTGKSGAFVSAEAATTHFSPKEVLEQIKGY